LAYDITLGICVVCLTIFTRTLNINDIVELQDKTGWNIFYLFPIFVIFCICGIAETNRHPFDMPEAESELVGGYTTEYSSIMFAFFFLAEYCSMLLMSFLIVHLFLGG
jgi:NADH-quinone oxidoreductase subunit H